jgi:hypothetical protein
MSGKLLLVSFVVAALVAGIAVAVSAQGPQPQSPQTALGTGFIYQGQLKNSGTAISGTCDIAFRLYDDLVAGVPVGGALTKTVTVANGLFATHLDFGNGIFTGDARWLEAQVRCPASSGSYTPLAPRQPLTAAPYALFASAVAAPLNLSANVSAPDAVMRATNSGGGNGVLGSASSHEAAGVVGSAPLTGVLGIATDNANINLGVVGRTDAPSGYGVYGVTSGQFAPAVYGLNTYYTATGALAYLGMGVYGVGVNNGVLSVNGNPSLQSSGSLGNGDSGVAGQFVPANGAGVYGATGSGVGVQAAVLYSGTGDVFVGCATNFGACSSPTNNVTRIDKTGKGYFNGGTQTGGADVAEFIVARDALEAGDVAEIDPDHTGQFRLAAMPNSTAVAGVISTDPGVSLNARDAARSSSTGPQLALVGRVPVKVSAENGMIAPGDLLVASATPGHAMRAPTNPAPGTVIGKALGTLAGGTGVIEMLVMLR